MKNDPKYNKALKLMAKYQALSTAAEMIRSHGEEGFMYEDAEFHKVYLKQTKIVFKQLDKKANLILKEYYKLGIEINTGSKYEDI